MTIKCRGICQVRNLGSKTGYYFHSYKDAKRCSKCQIAFFKFDGLRCPCCTQLLRTKPRRPSTKARLKMVVCRY